MTLRRYSSSRWPGATSLKPFKANKTTSCQLISGTLTTSQARSTLKTQMLQNAPLFKPTWSTTSLKGKC